MNRMRHLWTLRGTTVDSTALSWTTNGGAQNRQVGRNRRAGRREKNPGWGQPSPNRSEEHTSELQSLMRISYAVFCLKKKKRTKKNNNTQDNHKCTITTQPQNRLLRSKHHNQNTLQP